MTRAYTARQQHYIQSFMLKGTALLKQTFALGEANSTSMEERLDQLSLTINAATAVTAIAGVALAPPTLGIALVGAGAGIVILQVANGVVKVVKRHVEQGAPVSDETHWERDFLTWCIDIREVAEGAALRYRHVIDEIIEERSISAFAHVGAERVIKALKESLFLKRPISPAVLIEHLMSSAKLSMTHATEKLAIKKQYAPASLLVSNDAHAKWIYARSRMMACHKKAPFALDYRFYSSPQERMYLQTETTLPHYGYMSVWSTDLSADITRHHRPFVALTETHEASVKAHLCINYPVTWEEMFIYLTDIRSEVASGGIRRSLNQYLSERLQLNVIADCHGLAFQNLDLSMGDFSDINGRDLQVERCNLKDTLWNGAHLERAHFKSNQQEGASYQSIFGELSTWEDECLGVDYSFARMNSAVIRRCTIPVLMQDRGCLWDGAVLEEVTLAPGLEETLKHYVDEQRQSFQDDFAQLGRRCEENADALRDVVAHVHHLQEDIIALRDNPLRSLRQQMCAYIETLFDETLLPFYMDLNIVSSGTGATASFPLWDRLDQYMENANEPFFLLHGDIGSGKSLSVLRLAEQLAHEHWSADDWFPVYIKLKHINDRSSDNFLDAALRTLFSLEQIRVLKQNCRCVILLDGLDECGVDFSQRALLEECSDTAPQWAHGMPKIILTTQTRCLIDKNYHRLLRIAPDIDFPRESEYAIQPLNDAQIESYLQSCYPEGMNFSALGTSFTDIKDMAQSPLMLHIICVVLQQSAEKNATIPTSREAFYDAFMHHWSQQVTPKRPMEHFTEDSIRLYCRRIAFQMFVEQKNYIDRPYQEEEKEPLQLDEERRIGHLDPAPFTYWFDDTLWKKAGWLAPMSAKLMDDGVRKKVHHIFLHKSFQYKYLADALIDKLRGSETERLMHWNGSYLTDSLDVFDFLTRTIHSSVQKENMIRALKEMVSASGAPDGCQWRQAASNAITLLNALQVDFSTLLRPLEWRGIHIPRAYLKGAFMPSVDLSNSDLSDVMFGNDAVLAACNISGSNVARTRFSDTPLYAFTEKPPTFLTVVILSDTWVVTYDGGRDADSKLHHIVNRGVDGTLYPDFSGHMNVIRAGVWAVSDGERRFASGGDGETVRVQRVLDKGEGGEEIAKLKDHLNGAILTLSWSKEGNILAAGGAYPCIRLWSVDQKKCSVVPAVHGGTVRVVLLGQIRDLMLSAGDDRLVRFWTLRVRAREVAFMSSPKEKRLPSPIHALALSMKEDAFAAGCSDSRIYLSATDRASFEQETAPQVLQGHNDAVTAVIWNAWWLVSASHDATVRVWDVNNRTCVSAFQGDGRPVEQLAWLPGGRHAIAAGKSRMLFIVDTDVRSSVLPDREGLTHRVTCIAAYGKYLASGSIDGSVWLWDIKRLPVHTARKVLDHERVPVVQIEWSQDGQYIASRSHCDIRIRERSFETDSEIDRGAQWGVIPFDRGRQIHQMTWLNDLDSKQPWLALGGSDGQMHVWKREMTTDVDEWIPWLLIPWGIERSTRPIHCVAAAPSRRSILDAEIPSMSTLSGSQASSRSVLGLEDVQVLMPTSDRRHSDDVVDSTSPCSTWSSGEVSTSAGSNAATNLVAASVGSLIRIWDLRQEAGAVCVQECRGHTQPIQQIMWSPDGRFLASMDEAQVVCVWETSGFTLVFKDEQAVDEKHLSWAMIGEDKQWLVLGTLDAIRIFDTSSQFATREPVKHLFFGADQLCYHAGLLFLVKNRSVDMINLVELLFGERSSQAWVGRIGHGLCMQGCVATEVKNISRTTKAFIKHLGAVVSEDAVVPAWRFWAQRPAETVTPFPTLSPARAALKSLPERSPSMRTLGIFSEPRQRAASGGQKEAGSPLQMMP